MERPDEPLCSGEREEESKASCAFIKNVIKKVKAGRVGPRFEKDERWHFPWVKPQRLCRRFGVSREAAGWRAPA